MTEAFDPDRFDGVVLKHERVFCLLHGEPFRARYPTGVPIFMVEGFRLVTTNESAWVDARRIAAVPEGAEVPVKLLEAALDLRPICCRLTRVQLLDLYLDTKVGTLHRCRACNRKRLGTPYETQQQKFSHLCFECVCSASATPVHVQ